MIQLKACTLMVERMRLKLRQASFEKITFPWWLNLTLNTLVTSLRLLALHMMRRQLFLSTSRANSKVDLMKLDVTEQTPITGWKSGILRKLEELTGKRMQWAVCLLHFIELPFRDLFTHIDSTSSSPNSYTSLIVSKLPNCEKLPVVSFKPIKCDVPYYSADDLRKLSNDLR
ncbi:hypothetical protein AVEN_154407-1 [Araneus ventricosus]|uniref:Uncharacterized protein n=1 Tax=Araneus ventricosus TaxID=182803 RepID=A0A4Y2KDX1_ARAVE|nr:hypothetical protein AVEN_154407-1 [Araneus ventricosus]